MEWLAKLVGSDNIVTGETLEGLLVKQHLLGVLFCGDDDDISCHSGDAMEDIEDELEDLDIPFVRVQDPLVAQEYGIENRPAVVLFKKGNCSHILLNRFTPGV